MTKWTLDNVFDPFIYLFIYFFFHFYLFVIIEYNILFLFFRKLLLDIADNTTKSELSEMKMMSDLPLDDNADTIEFFTALEAHSLIANENVSYLDLILESKLNKKKVQAYVGKYYEDCLLQWTRSLN